MIVRRCSHDYDVVIFLNKSQGMTKTVPRADGTTTTITYPNSKRYFLWVDDEIVRRSDSFETIEEEYVKLFFFLLLSFIHNPYRFYLKIYN